MDSGNQRLTFEEYQEALWSQVTTERVRVWSRTPGPRWHTAQDLQVALGLTPQQIRQVLDSMVSDGILRKRGGAVAEFQRVREINPADLVWRPAKLSELRDS